MWMGPAQQSEPFKKEDNFLQSEAKRDIEIYYEECGPNDYGKSLEAGESHNLASAR